MENRHHERPPHQNQAPLPTMARHNSAPTERSPRSHPKATSISRQSPQPAWLHHPMRYPTQNPPSATKTDRDPGHDLPRGGIPGPPHRMAECAMPGAALREAPPLRYCSAAPQIPLSQFLVLANITGFLARVPQVRLRKNPSVLRIFRQSALLLQFTDNTYYHVIIKETLFWIYFRWIF